MTFSANSLTVTPLFGGALQTALPDSLFRDVSDYFPLQDNQEVYQHKSHPECCFTVELLDREIHRTDKEAAVLVFEDLVKTEVTAVAGTIESWREFQEEEERCSRYPALFHVRQGIEKAESGDHTINVRRSTNHDPFPMSDHQQGSEASTICPTTHNSAVTATTVSSSTTLLHSPSIGATTTKASPPPCEYVCEIRGLKHSRLVAKQHAATTREHTKGTTKENEKEGESKGVGNSEGKNEEEEVENTMDRIYMALFRFTGTVNTDVVVSFVVPSTFSPSVEGSSTLSLSSSSVTPSAEEQRIWNQALQSFCILDWNLFL